MQESQLQQPVSRYMQPVESAVRASQTVAQAIADLRARRIDHAILYFYVLDADDKLVGVAPTRRLLLAGPDQPIGELMQPEPISIAADATLELAMELFAMHRLLALPVVDADNRLLGRLDVNLYAEEAEDLAEAHRQADLFQLIGLRLAGKRTSPGRGFVQRMPWLACNLAGGLGCALIALLFRDALAAAVILAMFIPMVLTLAESIAMQSMTLSLPLVHGKKVSGAALRARLRNEWPTAAMLGAACAASVALVSMLWTSPGGPAAVLAVSIAAAMALAATTGVLIPAALHALKLDPRVAAGPLVLMLTDIATTTIYLGLGAWWLT